MARAFARKQKRKNTPCYVFSLTRLLPPDNASFHSCDLWYALGSLGDSLRPFTQADYDLSDEMVDRFSVQAISDLVHLHVGVLRLIYKAKGSDKMYLITDGLEFSAFDMNEGDGSEFSETSSGYVDCASVRACYPSSKRAAETLCMAYGAEYGADVVIARLSHTYGPGFTESDNRVYAQFIRNVLRGEDIVLKSRGEAFRSWLYVVDAAHAILRLLLDGERANAYNVAHSESNISIRELAELIARKADRKVVFDIAEDDVMKGNTTPVTKATFNTDKLKALGWKPLWDVESGFGHTIEVSYVQKL